MEQRTFIFNGKTKDWDLIVKSEDDDIIILF